MRLEQFVYTTAEIDGRKGYQIVAKSDGIDGAMLDNLKPYAYPMDMDPAAFKESRSLVLLDGGLVAYSIIKNAGTGYDGRGHSIYNHTFIFSQNEFREHGYDSRIFDDLYLEDKGIREFLPTLSVDSLGMPPPIVTDSMDRVMDAVLAPLFEGKRVALLSGDMGILQDILVLLPLSLRLVPFSTLVISPKRQPAYDFIMSPDLNPLHIPKSFHVIDPDRRVDVKNTDFEDAISYYCQLIRDQKYEKAEEIRAMFESIPGSDNRLRLGLSCDYSMYVDAKDEAKETHAIRVMGHLDKLDRGTHMHYYERIKDHLPDEMRQEKKIHVGGDSDGSDWFGGGILHDIFGGANGSRTKDKTRR